MISFHCFQASKNETRFGGISPLCKISSWCGDILMTVLELCLQTSTEAKIDINPNILRNIVEVMEEGILVKIWWKKRALLSAEDIKSEKEMLMPSKGPILIVTTENLQLTSDTKTILIRYCVMTFSSWISLVDGEGLTKGDKSQKMMEFRSHCKDLQKLINWPRDYLNLWKCLYKAFFWAYQMTVRTKVVVTSPYYWRTSQYLDFIMNLKGMITAQNN